jgi:hypothetical protein
MTAKNVDEKFDSAIRLLAVALGLFGGAAMAYWEREHLSQVLIATGTLAAAWLVRVIHLLVSHSAPPVERTRFHIFEDRRRLEQVSGKCAWICRVYEAGLPVVVIFMMLVPGWIFASGAAWAEARPPLLFGWGLGLLLAVVVLWAVIIVLAKRELARMHAFDTTRSSS